MARSVGISEIERLARRSVELLRANPRLFADRVRSRLTEQAPAAVAAPAGVSRTLDEVFDEIRNRGATKIAVYGDAATRDKAAAALQDSVITWVSHDAEDRLAGASSASPVVVDSVEAIIVAGPDIKVAYASILRECARAETLPAIMWADSGWEFCGSQLPVPADADDVDVYLFNHFQDYFLVKDPLLVKVTAVDDKHATETWRVLQPRETLHVKLSDLLPERSASPAAIDVMTTHPVLTKGRHHRWRVCADVHWRGSFTTLHGAHDYGSAHHVESRRSIDDLRAGIVSVVVPATLDKGSPAATVDVAGAVQTMQRKLDRPADELRFATSHSEGRTYGYSLTAAGTPFWFRFVDGSVPTLSGNHELSVRIKDDPGGLAATPRATYQKLRDAGFLLHPHALPLIGSLAPFEMGFSFSAANPSIGRFDAVAFDRAGRELERFTLVHDGVEPLFEAEVREQITSTDDVGLVVFGPDWDDLDIDPALINFSGDLIARHHATGDVDVTEFQSCWRNLGAKVPKFPHWIQPANAVIGRTNVLGRARGDKRFRTGVLVANASGHLDHDRVARARVEAIDLTGRARYAESRVDPFTAALLWLDELFDDLAGTDFAGALLVTSPDADLNCQLVTVTDDGRVSLQHLWGY